MVSPERQSDFLGGGPGLQETKVAKNLKSQAKTGIVHFHHIFLVKEVTRQTRFKGKGVKDYEAILKSTTPVNKRQTDNSGDPFPLSYWYLTRS